MPLQLLPTTAEQLPLIRNLYQFYAYESSDWEQEDVEIDGRFYLHEPHLALYWQRPDWSAQLILLDGFIAGFLLIERSELAGVDALEFADLFILKKYRRQGIGRALVEQVIGASQQPWVVSLYPQDPLGAPFWQSLLGELPWRSVQSLANAEEPQLLTYLLNAPPHSSAELESPER
ncbi:MAG: putative acetyltransferase [Pseudomonas sp.]|jgi:predicted acetyltransferase